MDRSKGLEAKRRAIAREEEAAAERLRAVELKEEAAVEHLRATLDCERDSRHARGAFHGEDAVKAFGEATLTRVDVGVFSLVA